MKAVIVTDCYDQFKSRLEQAFDNFVVFEVKVDPQRYYEQAHEVVKQPYKPLFLFVSHPTLSAIIAAQLVRAWRKFFIIEPLGDRLRVLKLP